MNFLDSDHKTISSLDCIIKSGLYGCTSLIPQEIPSIIDDIATLCDYEYNERCAYVLHRYFDCFTFDELVDIVRNVSDKIDITSPLLYLDDGYMLTELFSEGTLSYIGFIVGIFPELIARARAKAGLDKRYLIVSTDADYAQSALKTDTAHVLSLISSDSSIVSKTYLNATNAQVFEVLSTSDLIDNAFDDIINETNVDIYKLEDMSVLKLIIGSSLLISSYCDLLNMGEVSKGDNFNIFLDAKCFDLVISALLVERMGLPVDTVVIADDEAQRVHQMFYNRHSDFIIGYGTPINFHKGEAEMFLRLIYADDLLSAIKAIDALKAEGSYSMTHREFSRKVRCLVSGYCADLELDEIVEMMNLEFDYLLGESTARVLSVYDDYTVTFTDNTTALVIATESPLVNPSFTMGEIPDRKAKSEKDKFRVIAEGMGYNILDIIDREQNIKKISLDELKATFYEVVNGIKGE